MSLQIQKANQSIMKMISYRVVSCILAYSLPSISAETILETKTRLQLHEWQHLIEEHLPQRLPGHWPLKIRDITFFWKSDPINLLDVKSIFPPIDYSNSSDWVAFSHKNKKDLCVELDHMDVFSFPWGLFGLNDDKTPHFTIPHSQCRFRILWIRGMGLRADRILNGNTALICSAYDYILMEDEMYVAKNHPAVDPKFPYYKKYKMSDKKICI